MQIDLKAKNLFSNSLFWCVVGTLIINLVPAVQKARHEKQVPSDSVLTILMSLGLAINTVNTMYKSSGTVYYTGSQLPGINKEQAEASVIATLNNEHGEDGNF